MKKILVCGNINNFPLLLCEAFRAMGHDSRLILFKKKTLDRPESKCSDYAERLPSWIVDLSETIQPPLYLPNIKNLQNAIQAIGKIDFVVLNDKMISFAKYFSCPIVVLSTGSDLTLYSSHAQMCDFAQISSRLSGHGFSSSQVYQYLSKLNAFVFDQQYGFHSAQIVCYAAPGIDAQGDQMLSRLGVENSRRIMPYMSDTTRLRPSQITNNKVLTILNGARIVFSDHASLQSHIKLDIKGTDVLLKGFARFIHAGKNASLQLFEKGPDVCKAKELIEALGISCCIEWLPEMILSDFYSHINKADIVCDQIGQSFPGMVTLDSFAMEKPVLANLRNDHFQKIFGLPLPGFNVSSVEDVYDALIKAYDDPQLLRDVGRRSRQFAEKYLSPNSLAKLILGKLNP